MDKVSRFKLHLKNPHFSERKRGCAESAAQHSAVQAGRRPPRERREAALTALGGRRGTGQGVALSVSLCGPGRATTESVTFFSSEISHSPADSDKESVPSWRTELAPSYAEDGNRASVPVRPLGTRAGLVPQSTVIEASCRS